MVEAVEAAGEARQLVLIRAHPDLAGKAARAGALSAESSREQTGAALDRLSDAEFERFHRLNEGYRARFGFPFIICVRDHTKASILAAFEARLVNDRGAEIAEALRNIARIAELRLVDAVAE
jgi:2-oxo-4-hydroxy-4-carboxy-5-ureidoimidazoline decarboxylase